ncbi:MAG: hypothetical protein IJC53_08645 [Clostridia bacterium]|nr:hypothetical protein [Clostridia bacterium]
MKIQFLGTAAAEAIPAVFCTCDVCRKVRKTGGKDVRTRCQTLLDDSLLIDFGPDTYHHCLTWGVDLSRVRDCIVTHVHQDHFQPAELTYLRRPFAVTPEDYPYFRIWGSEDIAPLVAETFANPRIRGEYREIRPFNTYEIAGFSVTPLKANHGTAHPYVYLIEKEGKCLLYAHDSGLFPDETWEYLAGLEKHLDLISFDCTGGTEDDLDYEAHMCLGRNVRCRERLKEMGLVDESTRCFVNHFSHNGKDVLWEDLEPQARAAGFEVTYDGLITEI